MIDLYTAAKFGLMNVAAFLSASARLFRLTPIAPNTKSLYYLNPTVNTYILQGGSGITVTATNGTLLLGGLYYPMAVEDGAESYISLLGETANGDLRITLGSRAMTDGTANAPEWTLQGPI